MRLRYPAALVALTLVAGCGTALTPVQPTGPSGLDALSMPAMRAGFRTLHAHLFTLVDTTGDGYLSEPEAAPYFDLKVEYPVVSRSAGSQVGDGRISRNEFLWHATEGRFLAGFSSPGDFARQLRAYLQGHFDRLDRAEDLAATGDGFLQLMPLAGRDLAAEGLGFIYPKFRISLMLAGFSLAEVQAADSSRDGRLSQAEFEDLYMAAVLRELRRQYPVGPLPIPGVTPMPVVTPTPAPTAPPVPPALPTPGPTTAPPPPCPVCPPPLY